MLMFQTNIIQELDDRAEDLTYGESDPSVKELDASLWGILRKVAIQNPDLAGKLFNLKSHTVELAAQLSDEAISNLSSGTVLSFKLVANQHEICQWIEDRDYKQTFEITDTSNCTDLYWVQLGVQARKDVETASQTFGVGLNLVRACSNATLIQLSGISTNFAVSFALRFDESIIAEIISGRRNLQYILLKKIQQSITA